MGVLASFEVPGQAAVHCGLGIGAGRDGAYVCRMARADGGRGVSAGRSLFDSLNLHVPFCCLGWRRLAGDRPRVLVNQLQWGVDLLLLMANGRWVLLVEMPLMSAECVRRLANGHWVVISGATRQSAVQPGSGHSPPPPPHACESNTLVTATLGSSRAMYTKGEAWGAAQWLCHVLLLRWPLYAQRAGPKQADLFPQNLEPWNWALPFFGDP